MDIIDIAGLDHSYGQGETTLQVLFNITLCLGQGEFVVLMGASGSGKTTLLSLLGCLRAVQTGRVAVLGQDLNGADEAARIAIRRRVGFIFQAHNLHESLTARQNVLMGLDVHGRLPGSEAAAGRILDLLGLADRIDSVPATLSGGQKQRVAIARANSILVIALLRRLGSARGTTTLMVTHDPRIIDSADRILTMADGRITRDERRK